MRRGRVGGVAYMALATAMFAAPVLLSRPWTADRSGASTVDETDGGMSRIERILEVEGWASEGFSRLASEFSERPEAPTWEEVRAAMERLECTGLRYMLRVRSLMTDGNVDEDMFVRRPYSEPQFAGEFLRYLLDGPEAAVREGCGNPLWRTAPIGEDDAPPPADAP